MYNTPGYIDVTRSAPIQQDEFPIMENEVDKRERMVNPDRYPHCIVWTPIPVLTWILPFIGHMGICTSNGIIRDFACSYYVSEDCMAFGTPTKILKLNPEKANKDWDTCVAEAADVYKTRTHNLCCDNCHSMVALALNKMDYDHSKWNMVKLCFYVTFCGRYVSTNGFLKSVLPFFIFIIIVLALTAFAY